MPSSNSSGYSASRETASLAWVTNHVAFRGKVSRNTTHPERLNRLNIRGNRRSPFPRIPRRIDARASIERIYLDTRIVSDGREVCSRSGVTRSSVTAIGCRAAAYTRAAPRRRASSASARPRPRLAPVTSTVLPISSCELVMPTRRNAECDLDSQTRL